MFSYSIQNAIAYFVLCLSLAVSVGCGNAKDRIVVSGAVTYDGASVEDGLIRFKPLPGTIGNITTAFIANGTYSADGAGGVPFGKHRVEILSFNSGNSDTGVFAARTQLLPAQFNTQSELTAEITPEVDTLDFTLESK